MTPREAAHFRVLAILERKPESTQRELAKELGLSLSKTNYLVNALIEKGAIKVETFRGADDKLRKLSYLLTPSGIAERLRLTKDYLERKRAEYEALKDEIEALEADTRTRARKPRRPAK